MIQNWSQNNCVWLCLIIWFILILNFLYLNKKPASFFSEVRGCFFLILCYHARHLQQIHCRIYGLVVIVCIARLNICQILMSIIMYNMVIIFDQNTVKKPTLNSTLLLPSIIWDFLHRLQQFNIFDNWWSLIN